jgi:hypothetical protein
VEGLSSGLGIEFLSGFVPTQTALCTLSRATRLKLRGSFDAVQKMGHNEAESRRLDWFDDDSVRLLNGEG